MVSCNVTSCDSQPLELTRVIRYLIAIVTTYLIFVLYLGPAFMKNREPFDLRRTIKVYNIINIVINTAWFLMALYFTSMMTQCWGCRDSNYPLPLPITLAGGLGYMVLKVFDLLDTVFFVLRKKYNQVKAVVFLQFRDSRQPANATRLPTGDLPTRQPPCDHAVHGVVRDQVRAGGEHGTDADAQLARAHHHVLLLLQGVAGRAA